MKPKLFWAVAATATILMAGMAQEGHAHSAVQLRGFDGAPLSGADRDVPYSPKQTCVLGPEGSCHHNSYAKTVDGNLDNVYESHWDTAAKSHWNRNGAEVSYNVPYAQHGISASYHVQMGMNTPWGDLQREYYDLYEFTSSPGHYGGY